MKKRSSAKAKTTKNVVPQFYPAVDCPTGQYPVFRERCIVVDRNGQLWLIDPMLGFYQRVVAG